MTKTILLLALAGCAYGQYWYAGNNTTTNVNYPATPVAPAARNQGVVVSPYVDTTLTPSGVKFTRLTDEDFTPGSPCGLPVGQNWQTSDDPENYGWNSDGTMFFAHDSGNYGVVWVLDRTTGATTLFPANDTIDSRCGLFYFSGAHYNLKLPWGWSGTNPNRIYGIGNTGNNDFRYIDLPTSNPSYTSSLLVSFTGVGVNCAAHMTEYVHDVTDNIHAAVCGGTSQDTDPYVVYYNVATGQRHYLNGPASTIDGAPFAPGSDPIAAPGLFHQSQISWDGSYLILGGTTANPNHIYFWNLTTNVVKQLTYNGSHLASGHKAPGASMIVFDDTDCPGYPPAFTNTLLVKILYNAPNVCTPIFYPGLPRATFDVHMSWRTITSLFPLAPMFLETYDTSGDSSNAAFTREIFMVDVAGARFSRIAKSWCTGSGFGNQCSGQIDPTGKWAVVKSNWNLTLASSRMDVFLLGPLPIVGTGASQVGRRTVSGKSQIR